MFDLYKRVELGLRFLNNNVDENKGCLPYFVTIFKNDPAEARHDWPDYGDLTGRYVEAFVLARKMLNIKEPTETEKKLRNLLISYFSEDDGLSYRPKPEKPYYSTIFSEYYDEYVADGFDQSRVLWALLRYYQDYPCMETQKRIDDLIAALYRLLIKKDDYGYYDRNSFEPNINVNPDAKPAPSQFYFCGSQIHPLMECYKLLNNEKALDLAVRITNYIIYHSDYFFEDGIWNCDLGDSWEFEVDGHTHSRFATITGIIYVGIALKSTKLIEYAKRCYDWFVDNHCSGFGWSPEFLGRFGDENEGCETCAIMDQINCCMALCHSGYNEYYEKAEKIIRNQLLESQLIDTSLIKNSVKKEDTELSCFCDVANMVKGGFAGWAGPNDFIGNCDHHYCLMNCCGPSGIKAIYTAYENIYTKDKNSIFVNIFMNKCDKYLDIKNQQHYKGEVTIQLKVDSDLYINNRSWFTEEGLLVEVNNKPVNIKLENNYYKVGDCKANDVIKISHPLQNTKQVDYVNGRSYTTTWRGDSVVDIAPCGKKMPFYQNRI